jgi:phosphotransferase system  glucose/maltose/N-acetylglucosamine-specific IIC component
MSETIHTGLGDEPIPHPRAVAIVITAVLGLTVLPMLGPVAWGLGHSALREIDAAPSHYTNRSTVQVGMILGIIGTVFLVVGLALIVTIIVWATTGDGIKPSGLGDLGGLNSAFLAAVPTIPATSTIPAISTISGR